MSSQVITTVLERLQHGGVNLDWYAGLKIGILRLHNVYGPRAVLSKKRSQVIPSLIRKATRYPEEAFIVGGSGRQAHDFVYVCDGVDPLIRLHLMGIGKVSIQIGTGIETTAAELAPMIVQISGKAIDIVFDSSKPEGDGGRSGSYSRAKELLGWNVFTPLPQGLVQTYQWAEEQIRYDRVNLEG